MENMSDSSSVIGSDDDCDNELDSGSKKRFLWAQKDSYGYTYGI